MREGEVTAVVRANGLHEIEHEVIEPEQHGLPYTVHVEGFGMVAVGWHPVHRAYMAMLRPDLDIEDPTYEHDRWLPVQDHPDGSVEVRLVGVLGNTVGLALWMHNLPRFPPWYCLGCQAQYGVPDTGPCEVCGSTLRFQWPDPPEAL